jgi:hypothetical protein
MPTQRSCFYFDEAAIYLNRTASREMCSSLTSRNGVLDSMKFATMSVLKIWVCFASSHTGQIQQLTRLRAAESVDRSEYSESCVTW